MKVWKCFQESCITPCLLPWHPDHDTPDGCRWGGVADFKEVEIEPVNLLKLFEQSGEYSDFVRICRIPGRAVCTSGQDGKCSVCDVAKKFENPE